MSVIMMTALTESERRHVYLLCRQGLKDTVAKGVCLLRIGLLRGESSLRSGCLLLRPHELLLVSLILLAQQSTDIGCMDGVCIWCDIGRLYRCVWSLLLLLLLQ